MILNKNLLKQEINHSDMTTFNDIDKFQRRRNGIPPDLTQLVEELDENTLDLNQIRIKKKMERSNSEQSGDYGKTGTYRPRSFELSEPKISRYSRDITSIDEEIESDFSGDINSKVYDKNMKNWVLNGNDGSYLLVFFFYFD